MPNERQLYSGGLRAPIRPSHTGGFEVISGDDYIIQLIQMHVADSDSDNPFQDIGFGLNAVFANLSDQGFMGQARYRTELLFRNLQKANIAKLMELTFADGEQEGESQMTIKFLSLETNTEREVTTTVRRT